MIGLHRDPHAPGPKMQTGLAITESKRSRLAAHPSRRPLTESFMLPPKRGVHPMSQRIAHKIAFGPSALNDLARAFDSAWLELCAWGVEANTEQQIKRIRTGLAQRIMEYATEGEQDV